VPSGTNDVSNRSRRVMNAWVPEQVPLMTWCCDCRFSPAARPDDGNDGNDGNDGDDDDGGCGCNGAGARDEERDGGLAMSVMSEE